MYLGVRYFLLVVDGQGAYPVVVVIRSFFLLWLHGYPTWKRCWEPREGEEPGEPFRTLGAHHCRRYTGGAQVPPSPEPLNSANLWTSSAIEGGHLSLPQDIHQVTLVLFGRVG